MTDKEILSLAQEATQNAYAPYSRFAVGAAVECEDGDVFCGCNIENSSFGLSLCAEAVAIASAVAEGKRKFRRIAIATDGANYALPCGSCRQILQEFAPDIEVLVVRGDGRYVSYRLDALLPLPFKMQ